MRAQPGFTPHVTTLGNGQRRMLALHCTMAFGGAWAGFAKHAGTQVTLLAPDMPSHGASVDWDGISDFADTVYIGSLAAMDDAPMDIIGHSFGGATALRIAAMYPERVRSLTVIEPVLFCAGLARDPAAIEVYNAVAQPFNAAVEARDWETAARAFNGQWSDATPPWDTLPARTRAAMVRAVPDTRDFLYADTAGLLKSGGLDNVQVPTVIMRGELAHPAITVTNDALAEMMPNAVQSVIKGAGHMAPISHPGLVSEAVAALLARS